MHCIGQEVSTGRIQIAHASQGTSAGSQQRAPNCHKVEVVVGDPWVPSVSLSTEPFPGSRLVARPEYGILNREGTMSRRLQLLMASLNVGLGS